MSEPEMKIDDSGPAFPHDHLHIIDGHMPAYGLTKREYLAAHAPPEPTWSFTPRMPTPRPEVKWPDPEKALAGGPAGGNAAEVDAWDRMRAVARQAQWPWVWADHVLAARTV